MANTIKFGNGQWATKEDSILAYNDENANFKPLPFVTSRASTATTVNKSGLLETVASGVPRVDYLDNSKGSYLIEPSSTNLITQSEAFGNSYWTKSGASIEGDASTAGSELITVSANRDFSSNTGFWTLSSAWNISGGKLNVNGSLDTGTGTSCWRSGFLTIGTTYAITFTISNYVSGSFALLPSNDGGTYFTGNGTYTQTFMATSTNFGFNRSLASGGVTNLSIDNVSLKEIQGFSAPSADTPLGAFKLVEDTSVAANHRIDSQNLSVVASGSITISVILKYDGSREWVKVRDFATNAYVFFNLLDNSIGNTNLVNASQKIVDLGNDFKRVSFTYSSTLTNAQVRIYLADSGTSDGYTGDGTSGVYIFGAQIEQKSYATSYIPTKGSQISRLSETASQTVPDGVINSSEGVLYAEVNYGQQTSEWRGFGITDGSVANRIIVFLKPNTNELQVYVASQIVNRVLGQYNISNLNMYHKIAIKYKLNDCSLWLDGVKIDTDNTVDMPIGLNELSLSSTPSSEFLYADLKDLQVYNTALTDSELQTLTTI